MKNQNLNLFPIIDEINITYKRTYHYNKKITCSRDARNIAIEVLDEKVEYKEYFYIMAMNNANEVLGIKRISEGGLTATVVDIRLIFQTLLKAHAVAFIIFHNHPSGTLEASEADKRITRRIKKAADTLDIKLLDHLIITRNSYLSFADENML